MNEISNDVFSEVYGFLKLLDKSYIEKIPEDLKKLINEKRNKNYNPKYNPDIPIANQNISKQTVSIITVLNLEYWADDKEKEAINNILNKNSKIYEKEISEKYSVDNIFKNNINKDKEQNNEMKLQEYKKDNLFRKIFNRIKRLFR